MGASNDTSNGAHMLDAIRALYPDPGGSPCTARSPATAGRKQGCTASQAPPSPASLARFLSAAALAGAQARMPAICTSPTPGTLKIWLTDSGCTLT